MKIILHVQFNLYSCGQGSSYLDKIIQCYKKFNDSNNINYHATLK